MALTDAACRAAKGQEKLYKISDGGGLQLWVHPTGSRTWRLAYRFDGAQKNLTLGTYPDMKLVEARDLRDAAKRKLREGIDPAAKNERDQKYPFEEMFYEWFTNEKNKWTAGHAFRIESRMKRDALPEIGKIDMRDLDAPTVLAMLRKVEARDAIDMAKRIRQTTTSVFRYAVALGIIPYDPTFNLKGALKAPPRVKHHSFVREKDLGELLLKIEHYDGDPVTRLALKFTMQTMVRTGETRFATWSEFENLDGKEPVWRIPGERMKRGVEHRVPLAKQTVELLKEARQFSIDTPYVFPGKSKKGTMSENTMIFALYRMGYHSKVTVHGFRSTASTIMNESGKWHKDWIERQLAHVDEDKVRSAYNAAEYWVQRVKLIAWWNDLIEQKLVAAQREDGLVV